MSRDKLGIIVSTRSFFPSHLVKTAREQMTALLGRMQIEPVMLGEQDTEYGAVVTYEDARKCAALFRAHADEICGIVVVLPNFGEELGVVEAIEMANLHVPILIQACDDSWGKMDMANRRDAFCGKISLCNNLYQRGIPYTLTSQHTCTLGSTEFRLDLERFVAVCRVVCGLDGARIAALGARPIAFNTVRYSEKILQKHRISVQTVDFSEILAAAANYSDREKLAKQASRIRGYGRIPPDASDTLIEKQARLCCALEDAVERHECVASAVQCWDSVQHNYGCATCLAMSMMGEDGKPSACESDVTGAVSMLAAYLAAGTAPALMDWNNNIRDESDCCVSLHCSNFPKSFFGTEIEIEYLDVLGSTLGKDRCFGACKGQVAPGEMTFFRVTTDDAQGVMKAYVGEGEFLPEVIPTKGGVAGCHVPRLQDLLRYICKNGFEHHVCFVRGHVADVLEEAFGNYMGIDVYKHDTTNDRR